MAGWNQGGLPQNAGKSDLGVATAEGYSTCSVSRVQTNQEETQPVAAIG